MLSHIFICLFVAVPVMCQTVLIPTCEKLFGFAHGTCPKKSYQPGDCCVHKISADHKGVVYCLPLFVIAGANKCASSELQDVFRRHPKVQLKYDRDHEEHFFDKYYSSNCSAHKYIKHFPVTVSNAEQMSNGGIKVSSKSIAFTFDKTPTYMREELSMQRLHQMLPSVPIVITLRHPTSRSFSAFVFMCLLGHYKHIIKVKGDQYRQFLYTVYAANEPEFSFATYEKLTTCNSRDFHYYISPPEMKDQKQKGVTPETAVKFLSKYTMKFLHLSLYDTHMPFVLKYYPASRVKLLFMEEWVRDIPATGRAVGRFVGLPSYDYQEPAKVVNKGKSSEKIREDDAFLLDNFFTASLLNLQEILQKRFNRSLPESWSVRLHKTVRSS